MEGVLQMARLLQWLLPGLVNNVVYFRAQLGAWGEPARRYPPLLRDGAARGFEQTPQAALGSRGIIRLRRPA